MTASTHHRVAKLNANVRNKPLHYFLVTLSFERAAETVRARLCRLSPYRLPLRTSAFVSWKLSRSRPHRTAPRTYPRLQTARRPSSCVLRNFSPTNPSFHALDQVHAFLLAYFPSRAVRR